MPIKKIDLSKKAFIEITSNKKSGLIYVTIQLLKQETNSTTEKPSQNSFAENKNQICSFFLILEESNPKKTVDNYTSKSFYFR